VGRVDKRKSVALKKVREDALLLFTHNPLVPGSSPGGGISPTAAPSSQSSCSVTGSKRMTARNPHTHLDAGNSISKGNGEGRSAA
jgi:hypothetical protein